MELSQSDSDSLSASQDEIISSSNEETVLKKKRNKNFKNNEEQVVKWKIYEFVQIKITDIFSVYDITDNIKTPEEYF